MSACSNRKPPTSRGTAFPHGCLRVTWRWPRLLIALVCVAAVTTACAAPVRPRKVIPRSVVTSQQLDRTGLRLVFDEEFDGDRLDPERWHSELAWGRKNKEELQYYSPKALRVRDGLLTITASREPAGGRDYTSGAIASFDLFHFKYGYVEIRARAAKGQGLWPAFWLLSKGRNDPNEIDILEIQGHNPYRNQMSLHWGLGAKYKRTLTYTGPDFSSGFHTFGMEWQPDGIVWYIDGVERFHVTEHIPDVQMYIVANLAVGGRYPGSPDETTRFPASYQIDYIRVYERQ